MLFILLLFVRKSTWTVNIYEIGESFPLFNPRYIGDVTIRLKGSRDKEKPENQKWFGIGNLWIKSRYVYSYFKIFIAASR